MVRAATAPTGAVPEVADKLVRGKLRLPPASLHPYPVPWILGDSEDWICELLCLDEVRLEENFFLFMLTLKAVAVFNSFVFYVTFYFIFIFLF